MGRGGEKYYRVVEGMVKGMHPSFFSYGLIFGVFFALRILPEPVNSGHSVTTQSHASTSIPILLQLQQNYIPLFIKNIIYSQ